MKTKFIVTDSEMHLLKKLFGKKLSIVTSNMLYGMKYTEIEIAHGNSKHKQKETAKIVDIAKRHIADTQK